MGGTYSTGRGYASESLVTGSKYRSQHEYGKLMLQRPGVFTRRKCASKPPYVDARGFALSVIYGVPNTQLSLYPPTVYSAQQAQEDIAACRAGRDLPHYSRVIRIDKVVGSREPRQYALTKYHGYSPKNFRDGKLLKLLPYSVKDAQIDIATFQKTGKPYYQVIKATSTVIDPKRGTVRNWRDRGFDNKYTYDPYDPAGQKQKLRKLGNAVKRKVDVRKYPLVTRGGRQVRMIPCGVMPVMCTKGQKEFPYVDVDAASQAAVAQLTAKQSKARSKELQRRYSAKMQQLQRRMQGLSPNDPKYKRLADQMRMQQQAFRNGRNGRVRPPGGGKPQAQTFVAQQAAAQVLAASAAATATAAATASTKPAATAAQISQLKQLWFSGQQNKALQLQRQYRFNPSNVNAIMKQYRNQGFATAIPQVSPNVLAAFSTPTAAAAAIPQVSPNILAAFQPSTPRR